MELKTLKDIKNEAVQSRLDLFFGHVASAADSLDISIRCLRNMIVSGDISQNFLQKKGPEEGSLYYRSPSRLPNGDLDEDTGYQNPTHKERDEWYNRDRF